MAFVQAIFCVVLGIFIIWAAVDSLKSGKVTGKNRVVICHREFSPFRFYLIILCYFIGGLVFVSIPLLKLAGFWK